MKKTLLKILVILLISFSLMGCDLLKNDQVKHVVVKEQVLGCDVPASFFIQEPAPVRNWDWTQKTEKDVSDYVLDHRMVIQSLNSKLNKLEQANDNCLKEIETLNKHKQNSN